MTGCLLAYFLSDACRACRGKQREQPPGVEPCFKTVVCVAIMQTSATPASSIIDIIDNVNISHMRRMSHVMQDAATPTRSMDQLLRALV